MNTENIYQIIDDLSGFADQVGSEWMKERLAMLEAHIGVLEINQSVKWYGKISRKDTLRLFKKNDLLLFPSLRDSGGLVVLEAMSQGLVVATLNTGGPGQIVNNNCGISIKLENKDKNIISQELSKRINRLIFDRAKLNSKKVKSLDKVKAFCWKTKALRIYAK